MDVKVLATTFAAVFLAELGDKTQLATLGIAAETSSRLSVFAGAALALVATSGLAVLGGELVSRVLPALLMRRMAGALFIVLGVVYLASSFQRSTT